MGDKSVVSPFPMVGLQVANMAGLIPISGQMITHSTVREECGLPRSVLLADEASPLYHVRSIPPGVLLICGDDDMPARLEENRLMHVWLKTAGNTDVTVLCVPGRTHNSVYDRCAEPDDEAGRAIIEFIERRISAR